MFDNKIKELRKKKKISQQAASLLTGIGYYRYASLERGIKPSLEDIKKVIDGYGISKVKVYDFLFL